MNLKPALKSLILAFLVLMTVGQVFAANTLKPVVRERVLLQLEKAQELIDQRQFQKSFSLLNELTESTLSSYESSQVFQMLAFQFYQQDKPIESIRYYEKTLELPELPALTINQTLYNLAQLYFSIEKYEAARDGLVKWFEGNENAGIEAYELLGQLNYLLKQYPAAITAINTAIKLREKQKKLPKQNWLQLLQVMHYESGNLQSTIRILEKLVRYYPKKNYWLQLASLYGETGNSKRQLVIFDTAYLQGYLDKESELKTLAYLLIESGAPFKAATLLAKAIDNGEVPATEKNLVLLANAWRAAKETDKTISVLQRASELSKTGQLDFEIAQLQLLNNRYTEAVSYSKRALNKQSTINPAVIYLTMGIAHYKLNQLTQALDILAKINTDQPEAKSAAQWKRFIQALVQKQ